MPEPTTPLLPPLVSEALHCHTREVICHWCGKEAMAGHKPLWDNPRIRCLHCGQWNALTVERDIWYTTTKVLVPPVPPSAVPGS